MEHFRAKPAVAARLDVLIDIERQRDPRVVPFLVDVLTDAREPLEVRQHTLKRLRDAHLSDELRERVAMAILRVFEDRTAGQLQLRSALALGQFTDVDGVPNALGAAARNPDLPLDVRYSAFTSLERTGPTPECVALVTELLPDESLGACARSLLSSWHVGEMQ